MPAPPENLVDRGLGDAQAFGHPPLRVVFLRKVMPQLAESHTVIAPDLRGMGDSDKPPEGYDGLTVAEDVRRLVRGLGFERFHLVSNDLGGCPAYPLAASYPGAVRTLAMVDSLPPGPGYDDFSVTGKNPLWHPAFHMAEDVAEMIVSDKEREYLQYFYRNFSYDPAAIGEEDVDEYVRRYSASGGLRSGFGHYRAFFESARAPATVRAYASDLADFETWCKIEAGGLSTLPTSPETLALYISGMAGRGLKASTISWRLTAISVLHKASAD